jgi:hypothetical protein
MSELDKSKETEAQQQISNRDCFRSHKRRAYRLSKKDNRTQPLYLCDKTFCSMCLKNFYDIDLPSTFVSRP